MADYKYVNGQMIDRNGYPVYEHRGGGRMGRVGRRGRKAATGSGSGYCSKCKGPHVYKHGRA